MKVLVKIACTTLATTALLGVAGVDAASAAETSSPAGPTAVTAVTADQPSQTASAPTTKQFLIRNLSGYTLKLRNLVTAEQRRDNSELPADGTLVLPGQQLPMEMTYYFLSNNLAKVQWDVLDPDGQVRGYGETAMYLNSLNMKYGGVVAQNGPAVFAGTDGDITVTDREATTYDIPGGEGQRQLEVLNRYCEAGVAKCSFAISSERETFGRTRPFQVIEYNNTPHLAKTTLSDKRTIAATDTFNTGMSLKGSILGLVETTFNASYTHTFLESHEFSWTRELLTDPYTKSWLQVAPPIIEFTGDFTVTAGKTTWILRDVVFTTPDKDGVAHWFRLQIPLTEAEKATGLAGVTPETPAEAIARAAKEGVTVTTTPLD
jgi:hypothetical protein